MRRLLIVLSCLALLIGTGACNKGKKKKKGAAGETAQTVPARPVSEYVNITVDEDGFHPKDIPAAVGKPITLTFKRVTDPTCNSTVLFPSENIRRELPLNQPVRVLLVPGRGGDIEFSCPANTHTGKLDVQ